MKALGHNAEHLTDHLQKGTPDTEYFPFVAEKDWYLVTQDKRIKKKPHERQAITAAGLGAFIFTGRAEKSNDEMIVAFLRRLPRILESIEQTDRPFIYGIPDRGQLSALTQRTRRSRRRKS